MATGTSTALSDADVRKARLRSLLLGKGEQRFVLEVAEWFGAMQAQDLASGAWSFGVRVPGLTAADVQAAQENREVLRTWPMRGTVHFVPAKDAAWMVKLMEKKPLAGGAARREYLGITLALVDRAVGLLSGALAGGRVLTRDECVAVLEAGGVPTAGQVSYHLLWYGCQLGVLCQGPPRGKEHTFTLLSEWVPSPNTPSREEGLAIMARRYFQSHGPASEKDFSRWTGLGLRECREGIAGAGDELVRVETSAGPMLASRSVLDSTTAVRRHVVLPGFDEYMLGYGDRSLLLEPEHFKTVVPGNNGVFQSTLVKDGRVVGIWKRTLKPKTVDVVTTTLEPATASDKKAFEREFAAYGKFLGREPRVSWG
ncbi:winged helix DNA-binding domain-containing protein [Demequina sp.]|uniref:winged helix DNA-binding domain-containing protein n=1 Tax=Demequina sp. TaxID=2050685 RepID=UPI003D09A321